MHFNLYKTIADNSISIKMDDDDRETKESFICECSAFVEWFTDSLNEFNSFQHSWRTRSGRNKSGFPKKTLWSCTSLYSAYQQYSWPANVNSELEEFNWTGMNLNETSMYLRSLERALKQAIEAEDGELIRELCKNVLRWGGVEQRNNIAFDIKEGITPDQLPAHINTVCKHINILITEGFVESDLEYVDVNGNALRIDSGTTKVFSLLCDSLIIYDGRVASALAMLALKWWHEIGDSRLNVYGNQIPDVIRFSYDANIPSRKPNLRGCEQLRPLKVGNRRNKENIRATWLIEESLNRDRQRGGSASNFSVIENQSDALRAVETALFMVGYDIRANN